SWHRRARCATDRAERYPRRTSLADRHLHASVAQHHADGERLPARRGGQRAAVAPGGRDGLERRLAHVAVGGLLPQRHLRVGPRTAALIGEARREQGPVLGGGTADLDERQTGGGREAAWGGASLC